MFEVFFQSLASVLELETLLLMLLGVALGFVVGILPGLGGAVALALMLPFTFAMEPVAAFAFLLGMWVVTSTTGDITSILFGIPGEATSAALVFDGYPMSKRGEAGRALGAALMASTQGALLGALILALLIPVLRPIVLFLGPPELFMLCILGLTFVITLSGRNMMRGFVMAAFGLIVSMVGIEAQHGVPRYTFSQLYLWDGIQLVPIVVGLFAGPEILQLILSRKAVATRQDAGPLTGIRTGILDTVRHWKVVVRSSAIGIGIGAMPGLGGSVSQFIAYGQAKQASKSPELFGKGSIEGVLAAGANNNAKDAGSLIPTVAFGIPGSGTTAVLLGAFMIQGLNPGPEMLTENVDVTFSMVWIMVLANIVAVIGSLLLLRHLVKLTYIRGTWLVPTLLFLVAIGAYTSSNSFLDILVMLLAAGLGIVCVRYDWPRVPFLLAVVLGATTERYLFLSYSIHGWDWLWSPSVIVFALVIVLLTTWPFLRSRIRLVRYSRSREKTLR